MTDLNEIKDTLNLEEHDIKKLPQMLNVLTILTYVGSGLGILSGIYSYFTICNSVETFEELEGLSSMDGLAGRMMEGAMELATKQCDSRLLILIATLAACALTIYGAMQMRNLKKQGFTLYAVGELLLPVVTIILLGSGALSGMLMATSFVFPIIFIVLYFTQRKYLTN